MKVNWLVAVVLCVGVTGVVVLAALGRATEATAAGVVMAVVNAVLPQLVARQP